MNKKCLLEQIHNFAVTQKGQENKDLVQILLTIEENLNALNRVAVSDMKAPAAKKPAAKKAKK